MIGAFVGFIKNFFWIGYTIIDALFAMWVFNAMALDFVAWGLPLPITHVSWGTAIGFFLFVGFVGKLIQTLVPKIVSVTQTNNKDN